MRMIVTVKAGGREVGRVVCVEREVQNTVAQLVWMAYGPYRGPQGELVDPPRIEATVDPIEE